MRQEIDRWQDLQGFTIFDSQPTLTNPMLNNEPYPTLEFYRLHMRSASPSLHHSSRRLVANPFGLRLPIPWKGRYNQTKAKDQSPEGAR
jgi:hypothetical protein